MLWRCFLHTESLAMLAVLGGWQWKLPARHMCTTGELKPTVWVSAIWTTLSRWRHQAGHAVISLPQCTHASWACYIICNQLHMGYVWCVVSGLDAVTLCCAPQLKDGLIVDCTWRKPRWWCESSFPTLTPHLELLIGADYCQGTSMSDFQFNIDVALM